MCDTLDYYQNTHALLHNCSKMYINVNNTQIKQT